MLYYNSRSRFPVGAAPTLLFEPVAHPFRSCGAMKATYLMKDADSWLLYV